MLWFQEGGSENDGTLEVVIKKLLDVSVIEERSSIGLHHLAT